MKKWWEELRNSIRENGILRSLRARVFLIIVVVSVIPSVVMRYGILNNYEKRAVEVRAASVQNQLKIIASHLSSNNYLLNYRSQEPSFLASAKVIEAELEMLSSLYEGRVMIINGNCKIVKDMYGISQGKTMISEEVIKCLQGENTIHYDKEHGFIEMTTPIISNADPEDKNNSGGQIMGVLLTSVSADNIVETMEILNRKAFILESIMIISFIFLAFLLSYSLTKPFQKVTEEIKKVKEGAQEEGTLVTDYVETVHIVNAFNAMLKRMQVQEQARQEFVANVSHELRTPMTSLKVLADSLLMQGDCPAELYHEFLEDMVSEIDRENQIITDLLALVKLQNSVQTLNLVPLNINDLTEIVLKRLRPIARKRDVEVVFESNRPVVAKVDEVKLTQILTNLVENAIKYNKEHGWVKVVLDADHQFFTYEISDCGLGIPEEDLPHIFERFYRVDKSHSREIGGTGLGLAITKSAVLAHRGSITVSSNPGEGTVFLVKIPL